MREIRDDPEDMKFGQLVACVGRLQASRTDRYMERLGLYRSQAILLITLSKKDGLTHSRIAEKLEISPSAATKVIKRMEALHYVRRQPDPADERISRVYLEEEGQAVIKQLKKIFSRIDQILLYNLSPEEQNTLMELLKRVYNNLLEQPFDNN